MSVPQQCSGPEFNPDELLKLILFKVARFWPDELNPLFSQKDLAQEVAIRVLLRIRQYNSARSRFMTFVSRIVDTILVDIWREFNAQKRRPEMPILLLDELSDCRREHLVGAESHSSRMRDLKHDVQAEIRKLPPELAPLAEDLLTLGVTEIAAKYALHRGTIHRKLQKLRLHWKDSPLRSYLDRPADN